MGNSKKETGLSGERKKRKEAATKAWKTIKEKRRKAALVKVKKLTDFVDAKTLVRLKHPEAVRRTEPSDMPWLGNRVVSLFHKTPSDIACGRFWELRWAYGCPLNCSYCYLRGTTRGRMKPRYIKLEQVMPALDEAFEIISTPSTFNTGELCDSLMNPPVMSRIVEKFETQKHHKVYLLTKFGPKNVQFLLDSPGSQTICGWSINAPIVASRWERVAPHPDERIEAARLVDESGYDTRIRIDPIFPVKDWRIHYGDLLERILSNLSPSRIILGTPRGLVKTIKYAEKAGVDMSWAAFFKESSGWGRKLASNERKEIYSFFFDRLTAMGYEKSRISICKETVEMWKALGLKYKPMTCNCYGEDSFNE